MYFKMNKMKHKARQTQKLTLRRVVLMSIFFMSFATMGIMLILNLNAPVILQGKNTQPLNVVVVKDQVLITEKSLDAPILVDKSHDNAQTLFVKPVKREHNSHANF